MGTEQQGREVEGRARPHQLQLSAQKGAPEKPLQASSPGDGLALPPAHRTRDRAPSTLGSPDVPLPPARCQAVNAGFSWGHVLPGLASAFLDLLPGPSPNQGPRIPYLSLCFRETDLKQRGSLETSWMGMQRGQVSIWFLELAKGSCLLYDFRVRIRTWHDFPFFSNVNHRRSSLLTVIHSGRSPQTAWEIFKE